MLLSLTSMLEILKSWPNSFQSFSCYCDTKNRAFAMVSYAPFQTCSWKTTCLLSTTNLDISFTCLFTSIEEIQEPWLNRVWRMCSRSLDQLGQDEEFLHRFHSYMPSATSDDLSPIPPSRTNKKANNDRKNHKGKNKLEERPESESVLLSSPALL